MSSNMHVIKYFANYIEKEIGMVFSEDNYFQLENRLSSICESFKYASLEEFYQVAVKGFDRKMKTAFLDLATNNETSFFRDKKVFELIKNEVLEKIFEKEKPVNIWSVASSTGQEAYSVAMMIEEWAEANHKYVNYNIMGTDISERALSRAQNGEYTQLEVQRGLPEPLQKYFDKDEMDRTYPWKIKHSIKNKTKFTKLNLIDNFSLSKNFDLILCRNVLIYQSRERKAEILKRVVHHLNPEGFLTMGSGESPHGLVDNFQTIIKNGAMVYKKNQEGSIKKAV